MNIFVRNVVCLTMLFSLSNMSGTTQERALHTFEDKVLRHYITAVVESSLRAPVSKTMSFVSKKESQEDIDQRTEKLIYANLLAGKFSGYPARVDDAEMMSYQVGQGHIALETTVHGYREEFEDAPEKNFLPIEMTHRIKAWMLSERYRVLQGTIPARPTVAKLGEYTKFEPHLPAEKYCSMKCIMYLPKDTVIKMAKEAFDDVKKERDAQKATR